MLYPFLCQLVFSSSLPHLCPKDQAHALLQFRQMFTINPNASYCPNSRTLSWNKSTDCCAWDGVRCDETTGQVIELDLSCRGLQGKFHSNSSLFQLSSLKRLDLAGNDFSGSLISPKFGELSSLTHLDLMYSRFTGLIPTEISHLSRLYVLRISTVDPYGLSLGPYNFELLLKNLTQLRELYLVSRTDCFSVCNLKTLILLDLGSNNFNGTIPQCLGEMSGLQVLDLNNNHLSGTTNTSFNTENQLHIINLYRNNLKGKVPPSLTNCRNLEFLDLGNNQLNDTFPSWLGGLPDLMILSLRSNKLHGPISDSRTDNLFAQIRVIDLSSNGFSGDLPVILFENFQAMKIIDETSRTREYIAGDYSGHYVKTLIVTTKGLDQELPRVLTTYMIIDLSRNIFVGYLPTIIGDLVGLRTLNLSHNGLEGKQFDTFENSSYQGNDGLCGFPLSKDCGGDDGVPQAITTAELDEEEEDSPMISWQAFLMGYGCGFISVLSTICIMLSTQTPAWFSRMVDESEYKIITRMQKHKKRYHCVTSSTSLVNLYLSSVKFNGTIPESMSYLTSLHDLDMSSGNLSGPILKPLWNLTNIENLSLENNNLEVTIYPFFKFGNLRGLRLRGNNFTGLIPSNNQLEGPIPKSLLNQQNLGFLLLSQNNFSGQISSTICNLKTLIALDLRSNKLNGTIPQCWGEITEHFLVLDLSNNRLSGTINTTFSIGNQLRVIKLHGNKLEGKVPRSLINCKYLELLDLGDNELNDAFPKWLGTQPNLKLLSLRSNKLHGPIKASKNKKLFAQLQIMDLSYNVFTGNLPTSIFENFQAMKIIDENVRDTWYVGDQYGIFYDSVMTITTKGLDLKFARVLNRFEGYIPSIIGDLATLLTLNLSHNRLEGLILASLHQDKGYKH
ncbi:hypothetical protein CQW23_29643 [Capsicum baccatum]|uniref:Uncharacterized protein n=1 Tax=Capsicum baccatum TaxID=33114 RepID=A0A2G2VCL8_CAPBA|nr:hypothetical protein CQW23_29643 [Capsicum baccatum]